jgi:hypothetical protein
MAGNNSNDITNPRIPDLNSNPSTTCHTMLDRDRLDKLDMVVVPPRVPNSNHNMERPTTSGFRLWTACRSTFPTATPTRC